MTQIKKKIITEKTKEVFFMPQTVQTIIME
jgi:hypothetical protein